MPLTAATTGRRDCSSFRVRSRATSSASGPAENAVMSAPAEKNLGPAPVITTARQPESASAAADLDAAAAELQAAIRAVTAAMAPYEQHLREARARLAEIATERRRRERAAQVAHRAGVREQAKTGRMPALTAALSDGELFAD